MPRFNLKFHSLAYGLTCAYTLLVFYQIHGYIGTYESDLVLHVRFVEDPSQHEAGGYSLLHALSAKILPVFTGSKQEVWILIGGIMLALLSSAFYFSLQRVHAFLSSQHPAATPFRVIAATLAIFLVSMLIEPGRAAEVYVGVWSPNPWHNPTYSFARFFSILAFIGFVDWQRDPTSPAIWWKLGMFSIAASLSMWAKPSFMITMMPAFSLFVVWELVRGRAGLSSIVKLGASLVPPLVVFLMVRSSIYDSDASTNAIFVAPGRVWSLYSSNLGLSLLAGMAFPLFVLFVRFKRLSPATILAAINWAVALAIFYFLAESGDRLPHANFAWCYMGGMFFLFLGTIKEWLLAAPATANPWLRYCGHLLLGLHLGSGIWYFWKNFSGHGFY